MSGASEKIEYASDTGFSDIYQKITDIYQDQASSHSDGKNLDLEYLRNQWAHSLVEFRKGSSFSFPRAALAASRIEGASRFYMPVLKQVSKELDDTRVIKTRLTDSQLEECGLLTRSVERKNVLSRKYWPQFSQQDDHDIWLFKDDVHDRHEKPAWYDSFVRRIADLRDHAAEEGQPFEDISAQHATKFVENLGASIRPGAFLLGNGNIRLVWQKENEQVGIQFKSDGKVQYVILHRLDDGTLGESAGKETVSGMLKKIFSFGLLHLVKS